MIFCISAICSRPKPFSASPSSNLARVSGSLHRARSSSSSLKNSGSLPNSISRNCCADIGVPSGCQKLVIIMCWMVRALPSASLTLIFAGRPRLGSRSIQYFRKCDEIALDGDNFSNAWLMIPRRIPSGTIATFPMVPEQLIIRSFDESRNVASPGTCRLRRNIGFPRTARRLRAIARKLRIRLRQTHSSLGCRQMVRGQTGRHLPTSAVATPPSSPRPDPLNQLLLQLLFAGQVELIFPRVDVGVLGQGDFHQRLILLLAEHDADRRILLAGFHEAVEVVHVHLHLPQVLMGDLAEFQIDQHIAAQQAVVENQIHEEVVFVEGEPPLPRLEEEAFAHLQQETLDLADDGGFQVGLGILAALVQAKELQYQRFLEQVARLSNGLPFPREPANALFVAAESEALVQPGIELALELTERPVLLPGLYLIETALVRVLDAEEEDVVRPAQAEGAGRGVSRFARQCLANWGGPRFSSQ